MLLLGRLSRLNAFGVSLIVHLGIVLGMAMFFLPAASREGFDLISSTSSGPESEVDLRLEAENLHVLPTLEASELEHVASASFSNLESLDRSTMELDDRLRSESQQARRATIQAQAASSKNNKTGLEVSGAKFYGIEAQGEKFVFVVDSSTSMIGQRWSSAKKELIRSIQSLGSKQQFFVICFDLEPKPIFGNQPPKNKFMNPDSRTVSRVRNWLKQVVNGSDTRPAGALEMALAMEPDAIFLLSDGEIRDHSIMLLQALNHDQERNTLVPIHTVSLFSNSGQYTLMQIAKENNGTFRRVDRE